MPDSGGKHIGRRSGFVLVFPDIWMAHRLGLHQPAPAGGIQSHLVHGPFGIDDAPVNRQQIRGHQNDQDPDQAAEPETFVTQGEPESGTRRHQDQSDPDQIGPVQQPGFFQQDGGRLPAGIGSQRGQTRFVRPAKKGSRSAQEKDQTHQAQGRR